MTRRNHALFSRAGVLLARLIWDDRRGWGVHWGDSRETTYALTLREAVREVERATDTRVALDKIL